MRNKLTAHGRIHYFALHRIINGKGALTVVMQLNWRILRGGKSTKARRTLGSQYHNQRTVRVRTKKAYSIITIAMFNQRTV